MSEKKVVRRSVAIGLGVVCIALAVVLVIASAYSVLTYTSLLRDKDSQIASLNSQIDGLNTQISNLQSQVYNTTQLESEKAELISIVNLEKSEVWVPSQSVSQGVSSHSYWMFTADYAGYVVFDVPFSTTTNAYAQVKYSSHGVIYDNKVTVGTGGSAVFPVLPGSIEVRVGNTNWLSSSNVTVKITYHY